MTLLVVVAHPDDESFGCGSLLLHASARGMRTVMVCATRGEAGQVGPGIDVPAGGLGALRESELRAAAAVLDVDEVEVLDLRDSGMDGPPPEGSVCATPAGRLAAIVAGAIDRHRPSVVATLAADDGHRDHERLRDAAVTATAGSGIALYLQCLPRSLMHAWVRERSADQGSLAYTALPDIGTPDEQITTVLDTQDHLPRRLEAIALHRSQRSPFEDLSDGLRERFLTSEHLIRVAPPWPGGRIELALLGQRAIDAT